MNEEEGVGGGAEAMDVDIADSEQQQQQQMSTTLPVVWRHPIPIGAIAGPSEKRRGWPPKKHAQLHIDE